MSTINQQTVVNRIKKKVGKGRISIGKEMKGIYSDSVAKNPKKLTGSKGYQEEIKPALEQYEKELQSILKAMEKKNKDSEQYRTLVDSADKVQKQIQILTGGRTGDEAIVIQGFNIINPNATDIKTN